MIILNLMCKQMWLYVLSSCTLDQSRQGDELCSNPHFSFTVSNPTCQVANGFEIFHSSTKDSFPLSSLIRSWAAIFSACWRRMISVGIVCRPWCYIRKYETQHLRNINPLQGKNRHGGAINTAAFAFALRFRAFLDASRAHACVNMLYDIAIACHVSHCWMFLQETCILLTFAQVLHWGVVTKWLCDIYKPKTNDAWEALETEQKCQNWDRRNLVPGNTESWVSDCKKKT